MPALPNSALDYWLGSQMGTTRNQYSQLSNEYDRISREGIISPEEMRRLMGDYRRSQAPQIGAFRGRISADVNTRMGSRSGASQKAIANLVDVPAMFAESEFARNLYSQNIMSRTKGLEGKGNLWSQLLQAQMAGDQRKVQILLAQMQAEAQDDGGFGIGDVLGLAGVGLDKFFKDK